MVFCTYCGQSFTRDEHLERHILTHTNVKPFKCFTCHMSFARRDLLQRHYTVHGRDQNNQEGLPPNHGIIPKSAGRTPIACSNCAKTKTKCDKKFPCSRCAGRNLKCTLRPTRRASKNANRLIVGVDGTTAAASSESNSSATPEGSKGSSPVPQQKSLPDSNTPPASLPASQPPSIHGSPEMSRPVVDGPPAFFDQSPTAASAPIPIVPAVFSPITTPVTIPTNAFVGGTPSSGFEEFIGYKRDGSDNGASPPFLMDYGHLQFAQAPSQFDAMPRPDMLMPSAMPADLGIMVSLPTDADPSMFAIPELAQALPPVTTPPMSTPLSDLDMSRPMFYPGTRNSSFSDPSSFEIPAIIAAQDGWNCFRSGPTIPSTSCPKTARLNLERLEQSLKNHEGWSSWRPAWEDTDTSNDNLKVAAIHEASRDKLLAITQTFLHKALEIHKEGSLATPPGGASPMPNGSNFILLPPSRVLEYFLRAYGNSFERFFPMTSRGLLDANEQLLHAYNDKASSLLVLMMIAQGAMSIPSMDARWLNGGLTEACRISLFDLIEKNISMASDRTVLHAALLFITSAAWSGDKWQMDIAMGQRGMYFAMLRHSGVLEPTQTMIPPAHSRAIPDALWSDWLQHERQSRLIYSGLMVDQDLSLFRDTAPLFSVTEFGAPMPDADRLWQAKNAQEWSALFDEVHQFSGGYSALGSGARPKPLRDLFRHFLDDEIIAQDIQLTPLHLRLLLHPLQCLVHQCCQLLSCFSDVTGARQRTRAVTAASTRGQLEEVQGLLRRWYGLADRYMKGSAMCPLMQGNLVLFHLISLNAVTHFPEVERLARKEGFDGSYAQLAWLHKRAIADVEEAVFHCGQVLRWIRSMPKDTRPPWWAGAVYRVALVLWVDSLTHNDAMGPAATATVPTTGLFPVPGPSFAVDALPPEHPLITRYLQKREGVPTLTKRDGSQIPLDHPFTVLSHCVDVIDEGVATRFTDGIRNKLERLARGG